MKSEDKKNQEALLATASGAIVTSIVGLIAGTAMAAPAAIGGGVCLIIWGGIELCSKKK